MGWLPLLRRRKPGALLKLGTHLLRSHACSLKVGNSRVVVWTRSEVSWWCVLSSGRPAKLGACSHHMLLACCLACYVGMHIYTYNVMRLAYIWT